MEDHQRPPLSASSSAFLRRDNNDDDDLLLMLHLLPKAERAFIETLKKSKRIADVNGERLMRLIGHCPYPTIQIMQRMFKKNRDASSESVSIIRRAFAEQLKITSCDDGGNSVANVATLACFLVQVPLRMLEDATLREQCVSVLALLHHQAGGHDELILALLARFESQPMLSIVDELIRRTTSADRSSFASLGAKYFVLNHTLQQKQHFITFVCERWPWKSVLNISNPTIRQNIFILKLANAMQDAEKYVADLLQPRDANDDGLVDNAIDDLNKWMGNSKLADGEASQAMPATSQLYDFFRADIQRLWTIMRFLKQQHPHDERRVLERIHVIDVLRCNTVLELFHQHAIKMPYEQTRQLIEITHNCKEQQESSSACESEVQTLTHYTALAIVWHVLLQPPSPAVAAPAADASPQSEFYGHHMLQLHSTLRQSRDLESLCAILEDIFQLMFVRWEHCNGENQLNGAKDKRDDGGGGVGDPNQLDDDVEKRTAIATSKSARQGFVCRGVALQHIFTLLKKFALRKLHSIDYKQASQHVRARFQHSIDVINVTLAKYDVLQQMQQQRHECQYQMHGDIAWQQFVQMHVNDLEKSSSDDESRDNRERSHASVDRARTHSFIRRKASMKRRSRTAANGGGTAGGSGGGGSVSVAEQITKKLRDCGEGQRAAIRPTAMQLSHQSSFDASSPRAAERSVIPKILCTAETLLSMALGQNQLADVKQSMEAFALPDATELEHELQFLEQQQHVKQKLNGIYVNYAASVMAEQQEQLTEQAAPKATVEQIKQVAAKGFEVSKLISVIDNFAKLHRVQQPAHVREVLQRYAAHAQYGACLRQYEERYLNAVIICDVIVSLPLDSEIVANIVMVIKRQQQIASGIVLNTGHSATSATPSGNVRNWPLPLARDIGSMQLLESLAECLRIMPQQCTLQQLLSDNVYPLKSHCLNAMLLRQRAFHAIFHKPLHELARCEQLSAHLPLFQALQASGGHAHYYGRFCTYVAQLTRLSQLRDGNLQYHTDELLHRDPYAMVGELLFECGVTPPQLEPYVNALNLNLLHVLSVNLCPPIQQQRYWEASEKGATTKTTTPVAPPEVQEAIIDFIEKQNFLLAYVLRCIRSNDVISGVVQQTQEVSSNEHRATTECNSKFLLGNAHLPGMEHLAALYEGNRIVAMLHCDSATPPLTQAFLERYMPQPLEQLRLLLAKLGSHDKTTNVDEQIDRLVIAMIQTDGRQVVIAEHMRNDLRQRAEIIQSHYTRIASTRVAADLIERTLRHRQASFRIPLALRKQLTATLADIQVYARVSEAMQFETWPQAHDFSQRTPTAIFQGLIKLQRYRLCYEWCKVLQLSSRFPRQTSIFLDTLSAALLQIKDNIDDEDDGYGVMPNDVDAAEEGDPKMLLRILEMFGVEERVAFLDAHKDRFHVLALLSYAIDFLTGHTNNSSTYHNYQIALVILEQLAISERSHFWPLLKFPLLIVEQLIMNTRFEMLTKVLAAVRGTLAKMPASVVCNFCFDKCGGSDIHMKPPAASSPAAQMQPAKAQKPSLPYPLHGASTFMLLNFNLYRPDHMITDECIDLLLRIYATKALDYCIAANGPSSWEQISQSTDVQHSLDSLCDAFRFPHAAPSRDEWVRDEDANDCMCCRRAKFTMLMRRHHCRRCGRVVCGTCSSHRQCIPNSVYEELPVRVCNDCHCHIEQQEANAKRGNSGGGSLETSTAPTAVALASGSPRNSDRHGIFYKWQLSGNITHDKLLREEFGYEHAPSVALCLSILDYHAGNKKCIDLLLYHCRQLERLIVPNPEVDYELVAKMMNCLALAAKVRGGPAEIESIREHAEIIAAVVQHGCETLIPPGPLSNHSLRKLADSLMQAEKWALALDVHLKCGFPTTGVMAAHGLACLRAGCFDMAREKFTYCMPKLSTELTNSKVLSSLQKPPQLDYDALPCIKRPQRGPALLREIVKLIESMASLVNAVQPEEITKRASLIRSSNTSLATLLTRHQQQQPQRREMPYLHEPALNVLNTLANLKRIAKGQYDAADASAAGDRATTRKASSTLISASSLLLSMSASASASLLSASTPSTSASSASSLPLQSKDFDECMHYLLTYGSHADILNFLVERQHTIAALQYVHVQQLDTEHFITHIYRPALRSGRVPALIEAMQQFDHRLHCWRQELLHTCRYLEQKQLFNSLYQLQLLLKDSVRASMTCVRFYSMHCENFQALHENQHHLHNAQHHLQTELEVAQWKNGRAHSELGATAAELGGNTVEHGKSKVPAFAGGARRGSGGQMLLQMDARTLNGHINTIQRQLEVAKFLAFCECQHQQQQQRQQNSNDNGNGNDDGLITERILKQIRLDATVHAPLPTLFDGMQKKVQICILLLLCGTNIEDGYGLAYRIIEAYKIPTMKVFGATTKYLARNHRLADVEKLINCIGCCNNNSANYYAGNTQEFDEILSIAVHSACNNHESDVKVILDNLIKRIHSVDVRISCCIFIGQLKSAYLLANKHERLADVRRILRVAERTNQIHIRKLCEKKLSGSSSNISTTNSNNNNNNNNNNRISVSINTNVRHIDGGGGGGIGGTTSAS